MNQALFFFGFAPMVSPLFFGQEFRWQPPQLPSEPASLKEGQAIWPFSCEKTWGNEGTEVFFHGRKEGCRGRYGGNEVFFHGGNEVEAMGMGGKSYPLKSKLVFLGSRVYEFDSSKA